MISTRYVWWNINEIRDRLDLPFAEKAYFSLFRLYPNSFVFKVVEFRFENGKEDHQNQT